MKATTKAEALVPTVKQTGQTLVLLSLLALLALLGARVSASAPTGVWMAPGPINTPPPLLATTNGTIHVGGVTSPAPDTTNGTLHIGG